MEHPSIVQFLLSGRFCFPYYTKFGTTSIPKEFGQERPDSWFFFNIYQYIWSKILTLCAGTIIFITINIICCHFIHHIFLMVVFSRQWKYRLGQLAEFISSLLLIKLTVPRTSNILAIMVSFDKACYFHCNPCRE